MGSKRMLNVFIGFIVVIAATNGWAFDRYVSPLGNDLNLCTNSSYPCRTIQHAAGLAVDGDTVKVAEGVYDEEIKIQESVSGLVIEGGWNSDFTSKSDDRSKSVVRFLTSGGGVWPAVFHIYPNPAQDIEVTIRNFTIISGHQIGGIEVKSIGATTAEVTIEHNTIRGNMPNETNNDALHLEAGSGGDASIILKDNIIYNILNYDLYASAMVWSNLSIELDSNSILRDYGNLPAVFLSCNNAQLSVNSVNNIITSGYDVIQIGSINSANSVFTFTNDTVIRTAPGEFGSTVTITGESASLVEMTMRNSIIWKDLNQPVGSGEAISVFGGCFDDPGERPSGTITINRCDIGGTINNASCWSDLSIVEAGNINANPKLDSDFHLAGSSPCRNSALCGYSAFGSYIRVAPYSDIDGDDRPPYGAFLGCDMGADEFVVKCLPWLFLLTN